MPDPTSAIAERYGAPTSIREQVAIDNQQLRALAEARQQALAERQLAVEASKLQRQTQQDYDAADFLKHFQNVHPGPEYEKQRDQLAATYPLSGHDETVRALVQDKNSTHANYLEAAKAGGANEFPEGPARDAFHKAFAATSDINAARAEGRNTAAADKAVREAVSQGYLTRADFTTPEGAPLSTLHNADGTINYRAAQDLAAERAGKTTGATSKAEDRDLGTAQTYVTSYLRNPAGMLEDDPNAKELYTLYSQKLLEHARGTQPAAAPTPAPNPAGAVAPTLSTTPAAVTSQADYESLPPGATFLFNGKLGRKPQPAK